MQKVYKEETYYLGDDETTIVFTQIERHENPQS